VHSFWTLDQARAVLSGITAGTQVAMVGAGFIAFTILNSILKLGAKLSIVEIAPQILPRMIDRTGAEIVEGWMKRHGVEVRTGMQLQAIADADGRKRLRFQGAGELEADLVIMATGIRTNLDWLAGSGIEVNRGVVVDDHLRASLPNVYAAGDVAEGRDFVTGERTDCAEPGHQARVATSLAPAHANVQMALGAANQTMVFSGLFDLQWWAYPLVALGHASKLAPGEWERLQRLGKQRSP
jgi:NAD(P)H-nitrite reductase large subunit